jgi:predicted Fe-Mo cluster-binding NifX family protein
VHAFGGDTITNIELIAIPTEGDRGINDKVSNVFAKAPYFTLIHISNKKIHDVKIKKNKALKYTQGTGPIVMKNLKDLGVDLILTGQIGPGAKTLIDISGIKFQKVKAGTQVFKAVKKMLDELPSV